jgi:hypothetical protein
VVALVRKTRDAVRNLQQFRMRAKRDYRGIGSAHIAAFIVRSQTNIFGPGINSLINVAIIQSL